ncbi:hypothetical protein EK21DRAFT_97359 [Setomelanomma holmii]|uniref:DUF6604 domain-containing protein n=1 Tax=Setomelanomma holmii TaxID=210430 RepID=A0A9P4LRT8_9PLEO|nr:hypothetical protein EK21DRAFT_97359 [Setomelanomma holmii]
MDFYRRNELPENVGRNKLYTDSFQKWLLKIAANRNLEHAALIAEQSKKRKKDKKPHKRSVEQQECLIDAIAETKQLLTDTSWMRDLEDALRLRKEVTQYHRINLSSDAGHDFFDSALEAAKTRFAALIAFIPVALKSHKLADDVSIHIFEYTDQGGADESDDEVEEQAHHTMANMDLNTKASKYDTFDTQEKRMQQQFLVLCFLYLLNRVRGVVREMWVQFRVSSITAVTAALVTDFALSHIQQNVSALLEELVEIDSIAPPLSTIVKELAQTISADSLPVGYSVQAVEQLLCIAAIDHIEAYVAGRRISQSHLSSASASNASLPFMPFLKFYDTILRDNIRLPLWDRVTADILRNSGAKKDWLPFGFQILLDVQEIVLEDKSKLYTDVAAHGLDISRLMRTHVEYEDRMWATGKKPDYMSKGFTKFSNVFLQPMDSLLDWLQELLKSEDSKAPASMTIDIFINVHATAAGLAMSYFNNLYQSLSIAKVQWFLTSLCHLYNAARQVGGLRLAWPDLDFIIEMQGKKRIFIGDPPTGPNEFHGRYLLALCVSSSYLASDYRQRGSTNDSWLKRHDIFNHLQHLVTASKQAGDAESQSVEEVQQLQNVFSSMVSKVGPARKRAAKKARSRHTTLLRRMRTDLQSHELHSCFDYLSLYRRGFQVAHKMRCDILFDNAMQIARQGDISKNQEPDCHNLIVELFDGLKIKPKLKDVEARGDEISRDVVPLDQLKRIAAFMEDLIRKEGSVELDRAELRLRRNWDGLKASYAAEEARQHDAEGETDAEPGSSLGNKQVPTVLKDASADEINDLKPAQDSEYELLFDPRLPGSWPEDDDTVEAIFQEAIVDPSDTTAALLILLDTDATALPEHPEDTDRPTTGSSSLFDEFPNDFDSQLGSDSEQDFDSRMSHPALLDDPTQKCYQAYVSDEAEEVAFQGEEPQAPKTRNAPDNVARPHMDNDRPVEIVAITSIKSEKTSSSDDEHPKAPSPVSFLHERIVPMPRHTSHPKGIFHRLTFSSTVSRKHLVTSKRTSSTITRFALSRHRWGLPHRLAGIPEKHVISMRCYAMCVLAHDLLGKESRFQRQVKATAGIIKETKSGKRYDLQTAWDMADVGKLENKDWESGAEST